MTMTRVTLTILILTTWVALATGQNLVPNPSFEDTVHCPTGGNQIYNSQFWTNPSNGTPDYLNACSTCCGGSLHVPNNGAGNQSAHSGVAYAGIYTYNPVNREYIQTMLSTPLIASHKYFISFYVSLADYPEYSTNTIGVYFSPTQISNSTTQILPYTPQIQNKTSNPLTDKNNWMLIQDTIYAIGGEQYIVIGNFMPDSLSDTLNVGPFTGVPSSYYYVDDISVVDYGLTGIVNYKNKSQANIYPNPTSDQSTLQFDNTKAELCTLTLYDLRGQIMRTINNITSDQVVIHKNDLTNGLYYFVLRTGDRVIVTGKLAVD